MSLDTTEQILHTIRASEHILITTRTHPNGDALASCLAFYLFAKELQKKATIAIDFDTKQAQAQFGFLPAFDAIVAAIQKPNDVVLEFTMPNANAVQGLTYRIKNDTLLITLFARDGQLALSQPRITHAEYPYDAIVVIDSPDLESLGSVYTEHTEFFYHTPIINIDHQPDNEHFGELNAVDITAISSSEILYSIIEKANLPALSEGLATCLLTGIMCETKSFQYAHITPRSLEIASALIHKGARRDHIVEKVFRNKPLNVLQLWGRALSRIKTNPELSSAWSVIEAEDFAETKTSEHSLYGVLEDFLMHVPQAHVVTLLYPTNGTWNALVHTHQSAIDLRHILSPLSAHGNKKLVSVPLAHTRSDDAINIIQQTLRERWPQAERMPEF